MEQKRKSIHYKQLIAHKNNHYSIEGLDELADSILKVGLLHDVIVKPTKLKNKSDKQLYVIVSGHRRVMAIKRLVEKMGLESYAEIPCVILSEDEDELLTEMKLHIANITSRDIPEYDKMMAIERMNVLLQEAKEKGVEFKGRKKEIIAYNIGLKPSQVQTYLTVANYSDNDVKEAIRKGKLTIERAHNLIKEIRKKDPGSILNVEKIDQIPIKTTKQKIVKKILGIEKTIQENAGEFENSEEILNRLKDVIQKIND